MPHLFGYTGLKDSIIYSLIAFIFPIIWTILSPITGFSFTLYQIIMFFIITPLGVFILLCFLGLLDDLYRKSGTSVIAFIIEYSIYGVFLTFLLYFVFDYMFFENFVFNFIAVISLVLLPIFFHEMGHFSIALIKNYKPILIPLRLAPFFKTNYLFEDVTTTTLGVTFYQGEASWLLSSMGPMMNLIIIIFGIFLFLQLSFELTMFFIVFLFINFLFLIWNSGEFMPN